MDRNIGEPPDIVAFLVEMINWKMEVGAGMPRLVIPQWMMDLIEHKHGHRFIALCDTEIIEFETKLESLALKHALKR